MIRQMTWDNLEDINKSNEAFMIIGRLIPKYDDGVWSFSEELFEKPYEKLYPDENEKWADYIDNPDKAVFFYYDENKCIGQIRLWKNWNKFAYIADIAVSKAYRNKKIGTKLIEQAIKWAQENNLKGISLESQDLNLSACRFYKKLGFQIGGVDAMVYSNFKNHEEKAIFWYLKF